IVSKSKEMVELTLGLFARFWVNGNQDELLSLRGCNPPNAILSPHATRGATAPVWHELLARAAPDMAGRLLFCKQCRDQPRRRAVQAQPASGSDLRTIGGCPRQDILAQEFAYGSSVRPPVQVREHRQFNGQMIRRSQAHRPRVKGETDAVQEGLE